MKDKEEILCRVKYINHQLYTNSFNEHHFSKMICTYLQIEKEALEWVLKGEDE